MSRIDQISGIVSGAVEVCVAVIDQTVKSLAITAYSRVTHKLAYSLGFTAFTETCCDGLNERTVTPMGYRLTSYERSNCQTRGICKDESDRNIEGVAGCQRRGHEESTIAIG